MSPTLVLIAASSGSLEIGWTRDDDPDNDSEKTQGSGENLYNKDLHEQS